MKTKTANKAALPQFKVGDKVVWTSGANGKMKEKRGIVAYVVPPNIEFYCVDWQREINKRYGINIDSSRLSGGMPRDHESYLVAIPPTGKKINTVMYYPRVSALRLEEE